MSFFGRTRDIYRRSSKPKDIFWNKYVARPAAAFVVALLERGRVTPNQVTLASLVVFLVAAGMLILLPGHPGLIAAVLVIELSYVLDCVDGQLARIRGSSSPIGAHFDFLMDELKAFVLVAATAARLYQETASDRLLLEGLAALTAVASGISLTTFIRRPEYRAATGAVTPQGSGDYGEGFAAPPVAAPRLGLIRRAFGLVEAVGRFLIHYPSYLVLVAAFNRLDLFLHAYFAVNAAYAARALAGVALKLGRGP
ncbi:MAG TPA: CDP-alcohol phosphatidyltransferase family protein [Polyangia bacterium]